MIKRIKQIILCIVTALVFFSSNAQGPMGLIKGEKEKISFEYINDLIILPITLNGKKLSFILDTGAKNTILFGVKTSDSIVLNNKITTKIRGLGDGNSVDAIISKNNRIKINDIYGYGQTVYVILDDKFDLSLRMGKPIHGIIGYNLLKDFVISINFQTKKITFHNPKTYKPPTSEKYQKFNLEFHHSKPYINAESKIDTERIYQSKLLIDTGCNHVLWLFENYKTDLRTPEKYFVDYIGEGINGSIIGKKSKIRSLKLGNYIFNDVYTAFLDSVSTSYARSFKERDGSIGTRLLDRFHVVLNYQKKEIYLKKVRSFKDQFKYNRAGLEIAYQRGAKKLKYANNSSSGIKISVNWDASLNDIFSIVYQYEFKHLYYVYYVRPNSPAEKAGFKVGDFIQKINGKPAYNFELEELQGFFHGNKGEIIKIDIERNGVPLLYEFKLQEPL